MEITNELLAAYAEGNVKPEERKAIRQFLTEHPDLLESVAMMMDEDYGMEAKPPRKKEISFKGSMASRAMANGSALASASVFPIGSIAAGVAAGAAAVYGSIFERDSSAPTAPQTFNERLDDLLDELY